MEKAKLVELMQETLAGGDAPAEIRGKYHPAVISAFMDLAYTDIMQKEFDEASQDFSFDNSAKRFQAEVKYNKDIDRKYFDLPIQLVPLRPKNAAIRSISLYQGQQIAFAPISNASAPMWAELDAMKVDNTCSYMIEQNQVVFEMNAPQTGAKVMLKLIPSFSELEDKDNVLIPGGKNILLFQSVYQIMSLRRNRDMNINDNNSLQNLS